MAMVNKLFKVEVDIVQDGIQSVRAKGFRVRVIQQSGPGGGNPLCWVYGTHAQLTTWLAENDYPSDTPLTPA